MSLIYIITFGDSNMLKKKNSPLIISREDIVLPKVSGKFLIPDNVSPI